MKMSKKRPFRSLAETASHLLDPLLRKRAGLNIELIDNWSMLVGQEMASETLPIKIIWPRRGSHDEPFQPAMLVVGCQGYSAMRLAHETGQIIQRINAFFGYIAIDRIKIEQKYIHSKTRQKVISPEIDEKVISLEIDEEEEKEIENMAKIVQDDSLRSSLIELGKAVYAEKRHYSNRKFNN